MARVLALRLKAKFAAVFEPHPVDPGLESGQLSKRSVEAFLAGTEWTPLSVHWKGKKRFESSRSVSKINGLNVNISDATGLQFSKQGTTVRA